MAQLTTLEDFPNYEDYADVMAGFKAEEEALAKLEEISDALTGDDIVGGVLRWQRGDGYAFYVVTKARPLTLAWVPFCDRWSVEDALIRGLNKQDVVDQLAQHRRIRQIFSG